MKELSIPDIYQTIVGMNGKTESIIASVPPSKLFPRDYFPRTKRFRRGEVMFHQGDPVGALHIVQDGLVKEVSDAETGEALIVSLRTPSNPGLLGIEGLVDGEPHGTTAEAVTPVTVQSIQRSEFLSVLKDKPEITVALLRYFSEKIRDRRKKIGELTFFDLQARLAIGLLEGADQLKEFAQNPEQDPEFCKLTQEDLAAMIGGTRASVNKMLGSWEERGLIKRVGRRIVVLKPYALKNVGANEAVLEPFPSVEESPKKTIVRERMTA